MSTVTDYKVRQRHSSVSRVMVDAFRGETLTSLIHFHRLDGSNILQLIDDVVALDIRVRIRGVGDLEREVGQGQARVPRARPDPKNPFRRPADDRCSARSLRLPLPKYPRLA